MLSFNVNSTVIDDQNTELLGLSGIEFVNIGGDWNVVVSSEAQGALTTFGFGANGLTGVIDEQGFTTTSGTRTIWDMTVFEMNGETIIMPATRYEDQTKLYGIGGNGSLQTGVNPNGVGELRLNTAVEVGGNTYVYTSGSNGSGVVTYSVDADLDFTMVHQLNDTGNTFLGDVSAFANATVGGTDYLFVASAFDAGVASYTIGGNGALTLADKVSPSKYSGFWQVQDLVAVESGGQDYLVMASAGTSSLTVYSVAANGDLFETDHLIDSLDTRFEDASVLESFVHDGRSYVIAAGSDDGITVLEMTETGQLWEHASLADTYQTALNNVSGISAEVINGEVEIMVSSASDHGFTHITLDTSQLDTAIIGSSEADYIRGSSSADIIYGLGGGDTIEGLGGADLIVDGGGVDYLQGDGGRDVFMFVEDGKVDVILDYGVDFDQIDLSQFQGVFGMNDISINQWCDGVVIVANQDTILIQNQDNKEYFAEDFGGNNFLF